MKSVLFVALGFYNYDAKIAKEIENLGYEVTQFTPIGTYSPVEKLWNAACKGRYLREKCKKRQLKYMNQNPKKYDYVLVVVGRHLDTELLGEYRKAQPQAKFILYLWDDIARVENYEENKSFYDKIYSFDLRDVEDYGVEHLPLFYTDVHEYHGEKKKYTLNLSGMLHSKRVEVWDAIFRQCNLKEEECFLFLLGSKIKHFAEAYLPGGSPWMKPKYIHVNGMSMEQTAEIMKQSKVALDIQFGSQAGLTMRTMESLGAQTKLITTNPYVKKYDFYRYGNICYIDRDNPQVDPEFLKTDYRSIPREILERYSLHHWVSVMLKEDSE